MEPVYKSGVYILPKVKKKYLNPLPCGAFMSLLVFWGLLVSDGS